MSKPISPGTVVGLYCLYPTIRGVSYPHQDALTSVPIKSNIFNPSVGYPECQFSNGLTRWIGRNKVNTGVYRYRITAFPDYLYELLFYVTVIGAAVILSEPSRPLCSQ